MRIPDIRHAQMLRLKPFGLAVAVKAEAVADATCRLFAPL